MQRDYVLVLPQDLMKLKRKDSDLKQIITQVQGAKTRLKYSKAELENLSKKSIVKCQTVGVNTGSGWTYIDRGAEAHEKRHFTVSSVCRRFLAWRVS